MKLATKIGTKALLLVSALLVSVPVAAKAENYENLRLLRVFDGNFVQVEFENKENMTVRLACVDIPPLSSEGRWGTRASTRMSSLLPMGTTPSVNTFTQNNEGELVAEVFNDEGLNVGLEMIKSGYATTDRLEDCPAAELYQQAEFEAKENRRGMWRASR
ncbi:MAG: thermonuclease family protein [Cyanobacteriota bacterium]|nr:thermonuclease family protein [Cyanobacteriota bacterium]